MRDHRHLRFTLGLLALIAACTAFAVSASAAPLEPHVALAAAARAKAKGRPRPAPPAAPGGAIAGNTGNDDQYAFWRTSTGHIDQAWDNGSWHGPSGRGWSSASAPGAAANAAGHQFVVWQVSGGDIFEASFTGHWSRPVNLTRTLRWGRRGTTSSPPAVAVAPGSDDIYVFWRGRDGRIREAWNTGGWHGPVNHGWVSSGSPSVGMSGDGHQYVFWRAPNGHITEAWKAKGWSRPRDLARHYHWSAAAHATSAPAAAIGPANDFQYVFWRGRGNRLYEAWNANGWHAPVNQGWVATSAPSAAVGANGHQYVLWQNGGRLYEASQISGWTGAVGRWNLNVGPGAYAEVVQTTASLSQRMTPLSDVQFGSPKLGHLEKITVDDRARYQRVKGIGAAMTDSSAWLIQNSLAPATRNMLMDDLFTKSGIHLGFTLIPIGGTDFSVGGQPYTYDDLPSGQTDPSLSHFSIAHDQSYILPLLRQMLSLAPGTETFAVPWSPPAWMKANDALNDINHQGSLLPSDYQPLANYFVRFLSAYAQQGVPIQAIAPENEPLAASAFPASYFPAANEAGWISQNLIPALRDAALSPKIYGSNTSWQIESYAREMAASAARPSLMGLAWHCYHGIPSAMSDLRSVAANLDQIVTECAPNLSPYSVPEIVIGAIRNWASEVTLWNIATDPAGGPVEPPNTGCHGCRGLVTINEQNHALTFNRDYYELGQVGDFVQSGAWRIGSNNFVSYTTGNSGSSATAGLDDVALRNPDGSHALIVYNNGNQTARFAVSWHGRAFTYSLPAGATVTFRWNP